MNTTDVEKMATRLGCSKERLMRFHKKIKDFADLEAFERAIKGLRISAYRAKVKKGILERIFTREKYAFPQKRDIYTNTFNLTDKHLEDIVQHPCSTVTYIFWTISHITDPVKRVATMQEVFGRAGTQIIPILNYYK